MNKKERLHKAIFEMVNQGKLTLRQASVQCELSYRQTLRIYKRYKEQGDAGLTHQSRGQRSNRKHPHQEKIIATYKTKYEGFGPTLASEYLLEEDYLEVNKETLRLWLLAEGLWKKQRKRSPYRKRRERKEQFGELLQIDGSIHDWFGVGKDDCLLNIVDDATSKTLSMLDTGETTRIVFLTLWKWIKRYGIPLALYVDLKTVYVSPKDKGFSHVERACEKLGIRMIKARSPQAKGRVERSHAVYQDRFVKELCLRRVKTLEAGNIILESGFIDRLNRKFEKMPKNAISAHRSLGRNDLNQIFCWEYERQIQHDWTFSFLGKCYQIEKQYGACIKPKLNIIVRKHLDHNISVWYKDKKLAFHQVLERPKTLQDKRCGSPLQNNPSEKVRTPSTWKNSNNNLFQPDSKPSHHCPFRKRAI